MQMLSFYNSLGIGILLLCKYLNIRQFVFRKLAQSVLLSSLLVVSDKNSVLLLLWHNNCNSYSGEYKKSYYCYSYTVCAFQTGPQ